MGKYRKKPIVIEAIEWNGENLLEIDKFIGSTENTFHKQGELVIRTLEGDMRASKGDYIIKGISGEFYPCKPDIFHKTYEKVN